MATPTIGFVGQGFIGKNYADDFEARGLAVVRYALEEPYRGNKDKIRDQDIVFIAVPTPTTPEGFNDSIVREALSLVGKGRIAVIKSTMQPGSTERVQEAYPDILVLHSPEFLREATAAYDAAHPERNIIGIARDTDSHRTAGKQVLSVLPKAPYQLICGVREAEYIKYTGNAYLFLKVVFANVVYDAAAADKCDWEVIRQALGADSRIGPSHLGVVHKSGHPGAKPGRGAGGHCLIKDFAALRDLYERLHPEDKAGSRLLRALECKNNTLLLQSEKDLDLLQGVYGDNPENICE